MTGNELSMFGDNKWTLEAGDVSQAIFEILSEDLVTLNEIRLKAFGKVTSTSIEITTSTGFTTAPVSIRV